MSYKKKSSNYNTYLLDKNGDPVFREEGDCGDIREGELYVSVSQILSMEAMGDFLTYWLLKTFGGQENPSAAYRQYMNEVSNLGTRLHHYIECDLKGEKYPNIVADDMMPGLESWFRFKKDKEIIVYDNERVLHSKKYRIAGTLDIRARIDGVPYFIDLKTGTVGHKAFVQLGAYDMMASEMGIISEPHELLVLGGKDSKNKIAQGGDIQMHTRETFFKGGITKEELFVWFQCLRQIWFLKNSTVEKFEPCIKHMERVLDPIVEDFKKQFSVSGILETETK